MFLLGPTLPPPTPDGSIVPEGMVHGRFQPFHLGHLEYVLEAARCCQQLIVGLTNPDPLRTRFEADDPYRSDPAANPFPYHVRCLMVQRSLVEAGVDAGRFTIVPFPIHDSHLWAHYVPTGVTHFLRVLSPWGVTKVRQLKAAGYPVVDLAREGINTISGTEVRRRWRGGDDWRALVPDAVAEIMVMIPVSGLVHRVR